MATTKRTRTDGKAIERTFTFKTNEGRCTIKLHFFALLDLPISNVRKIFKELFGERWHEENAKAVKNVQSYLLNAQNSLYERLEGKLTVSKKVHETVEFYVPYEGTIFWTAKPSRRLEKQVESVVKIFNSFMVKYGLEERKIKE